MMTPRHKIIRNIKALIALIFIQLIVVNNSYAIKLFLNGQPFPSNLTDFNLTESVVYSYNDPFRPISTNTDQPFLCLGPNLAGSPSTNVSFEPSDMFKVYGLVGVSSFSYDYNPPLLQDKLINLQTTTNSQCVVKGFVKIANPSPGNPFIFSDSFENASGSQSQTFADLDITLVGITNAQVASNAADLTYDYILTNLGDQAIDLDIVDYFSIANNNTAWNCTESFGADALTDCGADAIKLASENFTGAVYLRNAHIEATGDSLIISVTRNPSISSDGTMIDLLATALVTNAVDSYALNNSETRAFTGNTNSLPTISTVATQSILEDSVGTGALAFTIADIETPAANLVVTATSSDQSIVSDGNIIIAAGGTDNDKTVTVVPNPDANTASGIVTITLQVNDAGGGFQTSTFDLTVTPVNDKPIFSTAAIADFPAGTTGNQGISNFIQNVVYGPTADENTQMQNGNPIVTNVTDLNGVLSSSILPLGNSIVLDLSGQGGTVTFDVQIQDDGMTANGGSDTSDPVQVSFTVLNTLPTISSVSNTSVNEDNSTPTLAFTIADAETSAGALTMTAMSSDTSIVPVSGIVFAGTGASRMVQITPAADQNTAFGVVTITLVVDDGSDTAQTTFDLTVNPINDAPSFMLSSNILWPAAESGLKQHASYANTFVMGPTADEVNTQAPLQFNISISGDAIFSSTPTIDTSGSLAYVLDGTSGTATIDVSLQDDGAIANGGVDTSGVQSFTITVQ